MGNRNSMSLVTRMENCPISLLLPCDRICDCFTHGLESGQVAGVGHTQDVTGDWLLGARG